jgi:hypothetical protein
MMLAVLSSGADGDDERGASPALALSSSPSNSQLQLLLAEIFRVYLDPALRLLVAFIVVYMTSRVSLYV